jgi:hypothetical protein
MINLIVETDNPIDVRQQDSGVEFRDIPDRLSPDSKKGKYSSRTRRKTIISPGKSPAGKKKLPQFLVSENNSQTDS